MKLKKIKLVTDKGREQEFEFNHALNVLRLQQNLSKQSWSIAETDKYTFQDNDIIRCKKPTSKED